MKLERVVTAEHHVLTLSGKQAGWKVRFIAVDDQGNVAVFESADRFIYRPPEVLKQRSLDRELARLPEDVPNYATKDELMELADFCIEQWAAFKAGLEKP